MLHGQNQCSSSFAIKGKVHMKSVVITVVPCENIFHVATEPSVLKENIKEWPF